MLRTCLVAGTLVVGLGACGGLRSSPPVTYNQQVQDRFMAVCLNAPQTAMHPVRSCRCTLAQVESQYPQARFVALSLAHEHGKPLPEKVKKDFEKCAI